jgi:hypothetical protein
MKQPALRKRQRQIVIVGQQPRVVFDPDRVPPLVMLEPLTAVPLRYPDPPVAHAGLPVSYGSDCTFPNPILRDRISERSSSGVSVPWSALKHAVEHHGSP